jgi:antirestriction protein
MDLPKQPGAGPDNAGNPNDAEAERLRNEGPRIYVASLSDYNAGILHGDWIAADQEPEELQQAVDLMLERSPTGNAEEFAIHDYEGFGHFSPSEYDSLDWISRIGRGIAEQGQAFGAWAERCDHNQDTLDQFEEAYLGQWASVEDYADELLSDLGYVEAVEHAVPESLQPYVTLDVAGFARDLELSGDITSVQHAEGVWIFDGRL